MALDCSVDYLLDKLGHDGSEIMWPSLPEPFRRRGHHIEEIQYVALGFGKFFIPFVPAFEYNPGPDPSLPFAQYHFATAFESVRNKYDGVLVGQWQKGHPHAVAWSAKERLIYDPEGSTHDSSCAFDILCFYAAASGAR